jgi:2-polyprenyl-6-methoxyphenol hydroxylase-like FAD-dependent oxidoreductase
MAEDLMASTCSRKGSTEKFRWRPALVLLRRCRSGARREPRPGDEADAFLNLLENGLDVLDTLGIGEEIEGYGTPTTGMVSTNHRGKRLGEMSQYATLLKRGLLNKGLREAAIREGVAVEFGKRLKDVEATPRRGVIARFEDGSEAGGDFLVGCDGINSQTRRSIMPDAPEPAYTGVIGCGGFTHVPGIPPSDGVMHMTFGTRGFFGYQVTPSGEIFWFQNLVRFDEPDRDELDAVSHEEWRESGSACTGTTTSPSPASSARRRAGSAGSRSTTSRPCRHGTEARFA